MLILKIPQHGINAVKSAVIFGIIRIYGFRYPVNPVRKIRPGGIRNGFIVGIILIRFVITVIIVVIIVIIIVITVIIAKIVIAGI